CVGLGALGIFAARKVFFTSGVLAYPSPPMRIPEAPLGDLPLLSATPGRGLVWGAAASAPSGLVWDWAQSREDFFMPFAGITMTSRSIGLAACVLGLGMLFAARADARKPTKQHRAYLAQPAAGPGMRGLRRNNGNTVCWTTCGQPGSIVMGRDPDPFIRQQILRDASGFFGGQP